MCATNLWAVNAAAFTPHFSGFTAERIGIEPTPLDMHIASSRVRKSSAVFTLTHNMCDCSTLIGCGRDSAAGDETSADAWLGWLRELPDNVPHVSRVAVLRAWSPEEDSVTPERARGIHVRELTEDILRDVRDEMLLTIDYPRVV